MKCVLEKNMQEAYCVTLKKLKEEMEEPQQESLAFINHMYSQLDELLPVSHLIINSNLYKGMLLSFFVCIHNINYIITSFYFNFFFVCTIMLYEKPLDLRIKRIHAN